MENIFSQGMENFSSQGWKFGYKFSVFCHCNAPSETAHQFVAAVAK